MDKPRNAKAAVTLELLDRQAVTLERLDALAQKGLRLFEAGVTYRTILAKRDQINAQADEGVQYDFNDALQQQYDETFVPSMLKEEG